LQNAFVLKYRKPKRDWWKVKAEIVCTASGKTENRRVVERDSGQRNHINTEVITSNKPKLGNDWGAYTFFKWNLEKKDILKRMRVRVIYDNRNLASKKGPTEITLMGLKKPRGGPPHPNTK